MSLNLVIALVALTVIITNVNRIEMAPSKSAASKDYYLTRAWGESSVPFTVIYSNYARTRHQQKTTITTTTSTTTVPPTPRNRRQNRTTTTTKKPSQLSNLFVSNSWGPMGK